MHAIVAGIMLIFLISLIAAAMCKAASAADERSDRAFEEWRKNREKEIRKESEEA